VVERTISHYQVLEELGRGGMGVVYRARDRKLDREVALKVLPPELVSVEERRQRFFQEARAAAALKHPAVAVVYEVDEADGEHFIAMELVEGRTLRDVLAEGPLPPERALEIARGILEALSAAHEKHIVHRDLKPQNIMIQDGGAVKVLDFGLAKLLPTSDRADLESHSTDLRTSVGVVMGTAAYMSPEQVEGKEVDVRSDVFSLGVLLYEMLSGNRPFEKASLAATFASILNETPPPPSGDKGRVPTAVRRFVARCLEKDRDCRYGSAREALRELEAVSTAKASRLRVAVAGGVAVLAIAAIVGTREWGVSRNLEWVRSNAIPEIAELVEAGDFGDAFVITQQALSIAPEEPELHRLWDRIASPSTVVTEPSGATVYWKSYRKPEADWNEVGTTPLENEPLPNEYLRLRFTKEGYDDVYAASVPIVDRPAIELRASSHVPDGMVLVPAGSSELINGEALEFSSFYMDQYEVTNAAYQEFVDSGGYESPEFWKHPFANGDRELSFEEAMGRFRDRTGRPGPATWELGRFPEGQDRFPVQGVSWYEASAYAEFVGKALPTVFHWRHAALGVALAASSTQMANFGSGGPVPVGTTYALDPFGTHDLGGNVKEWVVNSSETNRYILGGSWEDAPYMFSTDFESRPPFERLPTHGFRCAMYTEPLSADSTAPIETVLRDYSGEEPVSDDVFEFFRSLYSYDATPLNAVSEPADSAVSELPAERITFDAAYGSERVTAYLYLPDGDGPFQTVVLFPASDALHVDTFHSLLQYTNYVEFIVRSGRACVFPIYKGTFSRRVDVHLQGMNEQRDVLVQMSKDLGLSLDYLESRDDIDSSRLAFLGFSLGGRFGPLFDAVDPRFSAIVLVAGGLYQGGEFYTIRPSLPEFDPFHFARHSMTPTLMINGKQDFIRPVASHQVPLYEMLGTSPQDKRHVLFDSGHIPPRLDTIRETLDWLDRYLSPVE
jgi:tRNA A-37 threonylcarbamoyl transferase component Bud32/dienelactone hydrolase